MNNKDKKYAGIDLKLIKKDKDWYYFEIILKYQNPVQKQHIKLK